MDPIGFSLENFDAVGQYRNSDEGTKIDVTGVMFDGSKVSSPASVRAILAGKPDVITSVMTERMLTYALGRGSEYYDMPAIRAILRDAGKSNYKFSSIVMGIIRSQAFQMRRRTSDSAPTETASLK